MLHAVSKRTTLPPLPTERDARFSTLSSNSRSNLVVRSGENSARSLPFYWSFRPRGSPDGEKRNISWWGTHLKGWKVIVLGSWLNVLLVMIPVSWAVSLSLEAHGSHTLVFVSCILSLVPLVKLHDLVTMDLSIRIGGTKTGLFSASMSNIVETVVAISALRKCELRVVQSSLIGSILSKLLLVLGLSFFAGGMRFTEQGFDPTATQIQSSLLSISVGAVVLPAVYHFSLSGGSDTIMEAQKQSILRMSHGVSIILLCIYISYLFFQLWSHTHLYKDRHHVKSDRIAFRKKKGLSGKRTPPEMGANEDVQSKRAHVSTGSLSSPYRQTPTNQHHFAASSGSFSEITLADPASSTNSTIRPEDESPTAKDLSDPHRCFPKSQTISSEDEKFDQDERIENAIVPGHSDEPPASVPKEPQLSWTITVLLLIMVTIVVAVTADFLVESMDGISDAISKEWIALILLPAVSCIAECMTAVNVSVKDQLTLSISVAVGSTIQTALFVIPFMVTLAWAMGKPLSLLMDPFESLVLYISVQTMSYVVGDGKSNWLEGLILVGLYFIIAVSFWFYPGSNLPHLLAVCPT